MAEIGESVRVNRGRFPTHHGRSGTVVNIRFDRGRGGIRQICVEFDNMNARKGDVLWIDEVDTTLES